MMVTICVDLQEELEALRAQCEKLELERNALKQENAKLDAKVSLELFIM